LYVLLGHIRRAREEEGERQRLEGRRRMKGVGRR
jgi:hypothetical protein